MVSHDTTVRHERPITIHPADLMASPDLWQQRPGAVTALRPLPQALWRQVQHDREAAGRDGTCVKASDERTKSASGGRETLRARNGHPLHRAAGSDRCGEPRLLPAEDTRMDWAYRKYWVTLTGRRQPWSAIRGMSVQGHRREPAHPTLSVRRGPAQRTQSKGKPSDVHRPDQL